MKLPIELVPNSEPPKFRWRKSVETVIGIDTVDCEGSLPPSIENSVIALILLAERQAKEIESMKKSLEYERNPPKHTLTELVKDKPRPVAVPQQPSSLKKGK